jgi:hypothetical protein
MRRYLSSLAPHLVLFAVSALLFYFGLYRWGAAGLLWRSILCWAASMLTIQAVLLILISLAANHGFYTEKSGRGWRVFGRLLRWFGWLLVLVLVGFWVVILVPLGGLFLILSDQDGPLTKLLFGAVSTIPLFVSFILIGGKIVPPSE